MQEEKICTSMQAETKQQLFDAWHTHNRVNIYLLEAMTPEMFASKISPKAQRTVAELFAYIYAIRLMWLKDNAEGLLESLPRLDMKKLDIPSLREAFDKSSWAMEELFQRSLDSGRIKGFGSDNVLTFIAYFISYESHHRGQILMALSQAGHSVDNSVAVGLWDWGNR